MKLVLAFLLKTTLHSNQSTDISNTIVRKTFNDISLLEKLQYYATYLILFVLKYCIIIVMFVRKYLLKYFLVISFAIAKNDVYLFMQIFLATFLQY